jgi:hypothetical protein
MDWVLLEEDRTKELVEAFPLLKIKKHVFCINLILDRTWTALTVQDPMYLDRLSDTGRVYAKSEVSKHVSWVKKYYCQKYEELYKLHLLEASPKDIEKMRIQLFDLIESQRETFNATTSKDASTKAINEAEAWLKQNPPKKSTERGKLLVQTTGKVGTATAKIVTSAGGIALGLGVNIPADVLGAMSIAQATGSIVRTFADLARSRDGLIKKLEARLEKFEKDFSKEAAKAVQEFKKAEKNGGDNGKDAKKGAKAAASGAKGAAAVLLSGFTGGLTDLAMSSITAVLKDVELLEQKVDMGRAKYELMYKSISKDLVPLLDKQDKFLDKLAKEEAKEGGANQDILKRTQAKQAKAAAETAALLATIDKCSKAVVQDPKSLEDIKERLKELSKVPEFKVVKDVESYTARLAATVKAVAGMANLNIGSAIDLGVATADKMVDTLSEVQDGFEG